MGKSAFDVYEIWDLTHIFMPPRSVLFSLEPIGVGTPIIESLSSYIMRLAQAHCVYPVTLMRKMIFPLFLQKSSSHRKFLSHMKETSSRLNGAGILSLCVVEALEMLTLRNDLCFLTLISLKKILPTNGLLRLQKAWCSECYEEWRNNKQILYDPLLWFLKDVVVCSRHHCLLSTRCPYPDCKQSFPGISARARAGYCSFCHRFLGQSLKQAKKYSILTTEELHWKQELAQSVGNVLASIPSRTLVSDQKHIQRVIIRAVEDISAGNLSAFATYLGFPRRSVRGWYQGKRVPEITYCLWLCYRIGISFHQLLFEECEKLVFSKQGSFLISPPFSKVNIMDKKIVYQALENALVQNIQPPLSLKDIKTQLKVADTRLRKIHPFACKKIVVRYKQYLHKKKLARVRRRHHEIKQIALRLYAEGKLHYERDIASHLSHHGMLRDPEMRNFLKKIYYDLLYGDK